MAQFLTFSAFIQAFIITVFLGSKVTRKDLPALLLFFLEIIYTCVLFSGFWNNYSTIPLTRLHLPIGFAAGPVFYFFVRFNFTPTRNTSKRWLLWFIPFAIEFVNAIIYWILYSLNMPWADYLKQFSSILSHLGFLYFVVFFIAAIVFIVQHNTMITMNIVFKKQLKWFKFLALFIILFILDETLTANNEILSSSLIACAFTSTFLYFLLTDASYSSKQNRESKELLKEALSDRQKAVAILNHDGIIEYVNETFLHMTGYRHRDIIGRSFNFLQGDLTTSESKHFISERMAVQLDFKIDLIQYRKNGEAFMCHIAMTPVFSNDELTHFIAYQEDTETISEATPQDEELALLEKIKSHFLSSESYKNKQLQVADVAEALGIPARRIGEVLKKCEDKSFSEYVNSYRVQSVIDMMKDNKNLNITIEAISQMCGFNSKSVFNNAFKKEVGKTPTAFLEDLKS
jgi:PAS domain S-box-containing protein